MVMSGIPSARLGWRTPPRGWRLMPIYVERIGVKVSLTVNPSGSL